MSAYGYKRTLWGSALNVRFAPNSGHKWAPEFMSAYDPERTLPQFPNSAASSPHSAGSSCLGRDAFGFFEGHYLRRLFAAGTVGYEKE